MIRAAAPTAGRLVATGALLLAALAAQAQTVSPAPPARVIVTLKDDAPLLRVTTREEVVHGAWFIDYETGTVYLADDPSEHNVEISITYFAFSGTASDVTIRNLTIEKYAGPGQVSALNGTESTNWTVEHNLIQLNHGVGIGVGD
ncbi:MAG: hypothetical protein J0M00_24920, partial [Burkholderiales bacterium]|nr:hypothetical protein [Burkholderiales bacterium]